MSANQREKPKKSFEFCMSKKVAELTQVVHMLFTRNHEKEVEIEALKKSYENEIELVLEDARGRIGKLENTIADITQKSTTDLLEAKRMKENKIATKETEWRQKLADVEKLLHEERGECQNLRDLLINAQKDIEKLRQGVSDQLNSKSDEICRRDKEMDKLRAQLQALDSKFKDAQRDAQTVIMELQKTNEKLDVDLRQLHNAMDNSHKTRDQLLTRNKQLENDMKTLRREFNKKVTEMVNSQLRNSKSAQSPETTEELERLRREVQRYRLELSNRDNNFNRMFTEKQPVLVNQRNGSSSHRQSSGTVYTFSHSNGNPNQPQSASTLHSQNGSTSATSAQMQSILRERQMRSLKTELTDLEKPYDHLERQMTFPDRALAAERLLAASNNINNNNNEKQILSDSRPRTQGPTFMHERMFAHERHVSRQPNSSLQCPEEQNQILPQKHVNIQNSGRPSSSSLPSISSTPEQRRVTAQLTKPKPLSREMLYGK